MAHECGLCMRSVAALTLALGVIPCVAALATRRFAKSMDRKSKCIFAWYAFDALVHFIIESSFLYHSLFNHGAKNGSGPFAEICTARRARAMPATREWKGAGDGTR